MYRRAVHSFRVRRVPLPDNTLQRTVDSSTCHLTILLILTSQSLLLRKTIVQERVRGALKPAALTPLIPVSSSRRTQTDSLQESRRPRDQFLLSRSAGISPACCPSPSSSLHPGRGSPPNSPLEPLSSSSDRRDSPLVWAAPESMSASGGEVERERNEGVEEGGDAPGALPSAPFATAQRRFGEKKHKPKNH